MPSAPQQLLLIEWNPSVHLKEAESQLVVQRPKDALLKLASHIDATQINDQPPMKMTEFFLWSQTWFAELTNRYLYQFELGPYQRIQEKHRVTLLALKRIYYYMQQVAMALHQ